MNTGESDPRSSQLDNSLTVGALEAVHRQPGLAEMAAELAWRASSTETSAGFVALGLPTVAAAASAEFAAVAVLDAGRWRTVSDFGPRRNLPSDLMADALDRESARGNGGWFAAPWPRMPLRTSCW